MTSSAPVLDSENTSPGSRSSVVTVTHAPPRRTCASRRRRAAAAAAADADAANANANANAADNNNNNKTPTHTPPNT